MNDDRVYVRFKGKTLGPLALQKVQDLARRGQITRMHDLSSDGMSWVKAEEFGDVFPSSRPAANRNAPTAPEPVAPPLSGVATAPRPTEAPDDGVQWYVHINGENRGPMNSSAVVAAISAGQIMGETLVWRSGFEDWKPAVESFPQQFGAQPSSHLKLDDRSATNTSVNIQTTPGRRGDLFYELQRSRPWALLLGVLMSLNGILSGLYWVVFMIAGVSSRFEGTEKVIAGLIGLAVSAVTLAGGILILRYAEALKDIAVYREQHLATEAARRLSSVWRFFGVTVLTVVGVFAILLVVFFVMAAGIGAGVS